MREMRIATQERQLWKNIDWRAEIPPNATPWDTLEAKARIIATRMPERYQQILHLLADGYSPNLINEYVGIGSDVIRRIRQMHPGSITKIKECILDNVMEITQIMSERLAREAHELPTHRLANALSVMIDKAQLLSGGVTQRTETKRVVTREELQQLFEALPRAKANVIEDKQDG